MKASIAGPVLVVVALLSGCTSTYIPPSGRADFANFTSSSMQESFAAEPAAQFPAYLAFVRVQAPQYRNFWADQRNAVYGHGRYSILTEREVGEESQLERIAALPRVGGLVGLNRLLLAPELHSDRELREAAARLKADMVVLYTFDTTFHDQNHSGPLTLVTLGIAATKKISVHVTASALIMDTRTGFIYAAFESTENQNVDASLWSEAQKADLTRQAAERAAFGKLVDEFEKNWGLVVDRAKQGA